MRCWPGYCTNLIIFRNRSGVFNIHTVAKLWIQSVVIITLEHGQDAKFGLDPVAIWWQGNQLPLELKMPFIHHDKSSFLLNNLHSLACLPECKWPCSSTRVVDGILGFMWPLGENSHQIPWQQAGVDQPDFGEVHDQVREPWWHHLGRQVPMNYFSQGV